MDKVQFALESFKNIQDLIKFIDQKSSAVLVVAGLILTTLVEFSTDLVYTTKQLSFFSLCSFIFGLVTVLLLVYVIYISIIEILRPRLAQHYTGSEISLIYFNHLASVSDKTIMFNNFDTLTVDLILKNITDQIFEISRILNKKIIELHKSMNYLFCAIFTLLLFILFSKGL